MSQIDYLHTVLSKQNSIQEQSDIEEVEVTVDDNTGTPSADVTFNNKKLTIDFHNLKGETGERGLQGNSGYSGAAEELEVVNNLTDGGTTSALSAEMGKQVAVEGFVLDTYSHSKFVSQKPNIALQNSDMLFSQVGDYIELKVNANGTNGNILYKYSSTTNSLTVRYSSQNYLQIRFNVNTNWTYQSSAVDWNTIQTIKILLVDISDSVYTYEIYLDDVRVGVQEATAVSWNQVGYNSVMDLYYLKKRIGGVETTLTYFSKIDGAVGITDIYTPKSYDSVKTLNDRVGSLETTVTNLNKSVFLGEGMYYQFIKNSTLNNISSHFCIYQRVKGTDNYIGTVVGYYVYNGSGGFPNGYWRIERTNIVTIIDGIVKVVKSQAITAGENEFVLQWLAGSNYNYSGGFSGGFHYGETIESDGTWVEFVADGNTISTLKDIPLTPCKQFYYREYSTIHQHNDGSVGAYHLKHTVFKDCGYETTNDLKFVQALDYFAYFGIVCVSRYLSEYAMPEDVSEITDMGNGASPKYQFDNYKHRIHYEGNGYITDVESKVLVGANDNECLLRVFNTTDYNKYYRKTPNISGSTNNRLKSKTKVTIAAV